MEKIVYNRWFPFRGWKAMAMWPFIFVRKDARVTVTMVRHERIHLEQQKEMLLVGFYLWYLIEFLVRLVQYWNVKVAYRNILFEKEAYGHQDDVGYLMKRKHFAEFRRDRG